MKSVKLVFVCTTLASAQVVACNSSKPQTSAQVPLAAPEPASGTTPPTAPPAAPTPAVAPTPEAPAPAPPLSPTVAGQVGIDTSDPVVTIPSAQEPSTGEPTETPPDQNPIVVDEPPIAQVGVVGLEAAVSLLPPQRFPAGDSGLGLANTALTDFDRTRTSIAVAFEPMKEINVLNVLMCMLEQTRFTELVDRGPYLAKVDATPCLRAIGGPALSVPLLVTTDATRGTAAQTTVTFWFDAPKAIPDAMFTNASTRAGRFSVRAQIKSVPDAKNRFGEFTMAWRLLATQPDGSLASPADVLWHGEATTAKDESGHVTVDSVNTVPQIVNNGPFIEAQFLHGDFEDDGDAVQGKGAISSDTANFSYLKEDSQYSWHTCTSADIATFGDVTPAAKIIGTAADLGFGAGCELRYGGGQPRRYTFDRAHALRRDAQNWYSCADLTDIWSYPQAYGVFRDADGGIASVKDGVFVRYTDAGGATKAAKLKPGGLAVDGDRPASGTLLTAIDGAQYRYVHQTTDVIETRFGTVGTLSDLAGRIMVYTADEPTEDYGYQQYRVIWDKTTETFKRVAKHVLHPAHDTLWEPIDPPELATDLFGRALTDVLTAEAFELPYFPMTKTNDSEIQQTRKTSLVRSGSGDLTLWCYDDCPKAYITQAMISSDTALEQPPASAPLEYRFDGTDKSLYRIDGSNATKVTLADDVTYDLESYYLGSFVTSEAKAGITTTDQFHLAQPRFLFKLSATGKKPAFEGFRSVVNDADGDWFNPTDDTLIFDYIHRRSRDAEDNATHYRYGVPVIAKAVEGDFLPGSIQGSNYEGLVFPSFQPPSRSDENRPFVLKAGASLTDRKGDVYRVKPRFVLQVPSLQEPSPVQPGIKPEKCAAMTTEAPEPLRGNPFSAAAAAVPAEPPAGPLQVAVDLGRVLAN